VSLWAIVPVKPFRQAKSRLASVLGDEERLVLSREMLRTVLAALTGVSRVERTLVVSRDPEALSLGRQLGARTLSERSRFASRRGPPIDLNQALVLATKAAVGSGASAILVLPADLPLVTVQDVQALIELAEPPPVVVLSPDRRRDGTNALLASPASLIEYAFGQASYDRHRAAVLAAGARLAVCDRPGLALDLDLPEDLGLFRQALGGRAA
jgi:2-phospho-L-lactate guanylyltransferase